MAVPAVQSRIEVELAGESLPIAGAVHWSEDIRDGGTARLTLPADASPLSLEPGKTLALRVEPRDEDGGTEVELRLWVDSTVRRFRDAGITVELTAADPLRLCDRGRSFVSRAGARELGTLVSEVVRDCLGGASDTPAAPASTAFVSPEWLLQCEESGREFLDRVATALGFALYWNRTELSLVNVSEARRSVAAGKELDFRGGLLAAELTTGPGCPDCGINWIDAARRDVRREVRRDATRGKRLFGKPPEIRAGAVQHHRAADRIESRLPWPVGETCLAVTTRPDLRLGDRLRLRLGAEDTFEGIVERIDHEAHAGGAYANRVLLASPERWASRLAHERRRASGPYQAIVTHNDDAARQGRLRVRLCEDPARRPTPWIPQLTPYAGAETGVYWTPDVGDVVMVLADGGDPENLYVLGSIRGERQTVPSAWARTDNSVKALGARGDLRIAIDEAKGTLQLIAGRSSIELGRDGGIRIRGETVEVGAEQAAKVWAGRRAVVDAPRIDLAP